MTVRAPLQTRIARPKVLHQDFSSDNNLLLGVLKDKFYGLGGPTYDWPNPKGRDYPVALRFFGHEAWFNLAASPPSPPFLQTQWPNPRGAAYPISLRFWVGGTLATDASIPVPRRLPDNPRGVAFPSYLRGFVQAVPLNLLGQDAFYGGAGGGGHTIDLGNPPRRPDQSFQRFWSQTLVQTTLFAPPDQPFSQDDWSVPRAAQGSIGLRTELNVLRQQLLNQDRFFGAAGEPPQSVIDQWTVPKALRFAPWLRLESTNVLLSVFIPPGQPVGQSECGLPSPGYRTNPTLEWRASLLLDVVAPVIEPPPPAGPDFGAPITNANAVDYPSNYEICDRTGFRVLRGTLKKQWDGLMVRPESWEPRHPQDFVRARPEHSKGSPRPEQPDTFLADTSPVDPDDL
jgi:hypothetical protein